MQKCKLAQVGMAVKHAGIFVLLIFCSCLAVTVIGTATVAKSAAAVAQAKSRSSPNALSGLRMRD